MPRRNDISKVLIVYAGLLVTPLMAWGQTHAWERVSQFCGQIKVDKKNVSRRPFVIYKANSESDTCCDKLTVVHRAKTEWLGYFHVRKLKAGYYFAVFNSKKGDIAIPFFLRADYDGRDCRPV